MGKSYGKDKDGNELRTQREVILCYLRENPGARITQWQAIKEFGFTRLSAIVKQIERRYGIVLRRRKIEVQTRYGAKTFITEYWLGE